VSALDPAERALAHVRGGDGALASVTAERSLLLRFARSRPTQATAVDDATVSISVLCDGHVGTASTNRDDDESLARCARAAEAAAESAARSRGSGSYPGFPSPAPVKQHDGFDAATAELDPGPGGRALAAAFEVAAATGLEAHGVWSAGDVETAIATTTGIGLGDRVTDAFMKTTCIAPDGRSGWANRAGAKVADLDPLATAEAAAERATAPSEGATTSSSSSPASTRSCSHRRRSRRCSAGSRCRRSTGWRTPKAAARLSGASARGS